MLISSQENGNENLDCECVMNNKILNERGKLKIGEHTYTYMHIFHVKLNL